MTISAIRKLTINNKSFSLNALIANPDAYLPLMQPLLKPAIFNKKSSETSDNYFKRIFNLLYTKLNPTESSESSTRTRSVERIVLDESCDAILSALGIDIVKKCPKRSSVTFKSTGNSYRMNNEEIIKLSQAVKHSANLNVKNKLLNKKISFGVELEFIGVENNLNSFITAMKKAVGEDRFKFVGGYNKNKGQCWVLGSDISVKPKGDQRERGMRGYELTSPILNLGSRKDLKELSLVCEIIRSIFGGEVNSSCGTHVHMSFPVEKASDELVIHFARSYRKSERSLFDKLVPAARRENKARYAKTVNVRYIRDRYRKLNFNNVKKDSDNMHLEFRQLDGTLDYNKIISWVKLQKMFVELTLESWKSNYIDEDKPIKIELDDVIVTQKLGKDSIETLMKMSKLVA